MKGSLLLPILILGSLGISLWAYQRGKRSIAWLFGAVAFLLVIAVPLWRNSLASLVSSPKSLAVLGGLTFIGAIAFYFEAIRAHKHHKIRTPVIAIVFGTSLALAIGSLPRLLKQLTRSPGAAGHAMTQSMTQINSGQAAHAVPHQQAMTVVAIGIGAVLALIIAARRTPHGRRPSRGSHGGTPPAISGGSGSGGGTGRSPIPIGGSRGKR